MLKEIFSDYIQFRKDLNIHNFFYYFWKISLPLIFTIIIYIIFLIFSENINHKDISTALVSTNSIIVAFLVLSLTVLLTQEIKNLPNTDINYKKFLVTNAEVSVLLILSSIIISIFYMLLASSKFCTSNLVYTYGLNTIGFISIFITVLVIKTSIDDLLLLSSKLK